MLFAPPLSESVCPEAWHGGTRRQPLWRCLDGGLDAASVHTLLRHAGLPREELLHMGAPAWILEPFCGPVPEQTAAVLLGRVAWDAIYGDRLAMVWEPGPMRNSLVLDMGRYVLGRWFR